MRRKASGEIRPTMSKRRSLWRPVSPFRPRCSLRPVRRLKSIPGQANIWSGHKIARDSADDVGKAEAQSRHRVAFQDFLVASEASLHIKSVLRLAAKLHLPLSSKHNPVFAHTRFSIKGSIFSVKGNTGNTGNSHLNHQNCR